MSADILIASGGVITLSDPGGKPQRLYFGRSRVDAPESGTFPPITLPLMVLPDGLRHSMSRPLFAAKAKSTLPVADTRVDGIVASVSTAVAGGSDSLIDPAQLLSRGAGRAEKKPAPPLAADATKAAGDETASLAATESDAIEKRPLVNEASNEEKDAASEPASATVLMTDAFFGGELSLSALRGGAIFVDARMGLFPGTAVSAMLLGINASEMMMGLASSETFWMAERAIAQARAVLLMRDATVGLHVDPHLGMLLGYAN
ncbi:hypothetical protein [Caballeronia calidae]|uniref:hypothetical protein n=1 Tax=Caballeronia calidae TaxID=1777139 RepID=UPI0012FD76FE|nr:hypothetical protein [Caballeronia calidae]